MKRIESHRVFFGFIGELGAGWLVVLFTALFLSACDSDTPPPKGELVVVVDSDLSIPKDIDHLRFEANTRNRALAQKDVALVGEGVPRLPATFRVAYPGGAEPVTVRAVASTRGVPRIQREAVTPIPKSYVGVLRLPLSYLCTGTANSDGSSTCPESETCILGSCASSTVPESALSSEPWATNGDGRPPSGLACLDVVSCFDATRSADVDLEDCSIEAPERTAEDRLNVALQFPGDGPGVCSFDRCWVVLDAGPEGWSLDGTRVRLPAAVCADRDVQLVLSTDCPQKVPSRPLCVANSAGISGPSEPGTAAEVPPLEITGSACPGAALRACGNCGSQTRVCTNGEWSDWSECTDEGECSPNETQRCGNDGAQTCEGNCQWGLCVHPTCDGPRSQSCGNCGTQTRVCTNGEWSDWSECSGEGECAPDTGETCAEGGTRTCGGDCRFSECVVSACDGSASQSCGNCGTQYRTCDGAGTWSAWSDCMTEAACTPDASEECGTQGTRYCGGSCQWGECGGQECFGANTEACGNCGTRRRVCNNGVWSEWSECSGQGDCSPNTSQACGNGGTQTCGGNCQYGECQGQTCSGAATEACDNCGTRTRTCNNGVWSGWSACSNQGTCAPNSTQGCQNGGTQTCTNSCTWGSCGNQQCEGASTEECGNCGTRTRTCNNSTGQWSAWSSCAGQGACARNTSRDCGVQNSGSQTCSATCQWGACTGQACVGPATQPCGQCGTQTRTCNNGVWSDWGACGGQGACSPTTARSCGVQNSGTQTCGIDCTWGECTGQICTGSDTQSCERCGRQTRTCNNGDWSGWSACSGQGSCTPNDTQRCGYQSSGTQTCGSNCQWGECFGQSCNPDEPLERACGNCGTQTRRCDNGILTPWSACSGEGACRPASPSASAEQRSCGDGGTQVCTASCTWGPCQECIGPNQQDCSSRAIACGIQRRECRSGQWSNWSECKSEGECTPGTETSSGCSGEFNFKSCNAQCQWGACTQSLGYTTVVSRLSNPGPLAIDADNLYFANAGEIARVWLGGEVFEVTSMAKSQGTVTSLVVAGKYLYWNLDTGSVLRVPIDAKGATAETLVQSTTGTSGGLVVDTTRFYNYTGGYTLRGRPINGQSPSAWELVLKRSGPLFGMVSDGKNLYWTHGGETQSGALIPGSGWIGQASIEGKELDPILEKGLTQPSFLAEGDGALYFAATNAIQAIPAKAGSTPKVLIQRAPNVNGLVLNGSLLYWTAGTSANANGRVMRASTSGTNETLMVALGGVIPTHIVDSASYVYFAVPTAILRVSKLNLIDIIGVLPIRPPVLLLP